MGTQQFTVSFIRDEKIKKEPGIVVFSKKSCWKYAPFLQVKCIQQSMPWDPIVGLKWP